MQPTRILVLYNDPVLPESHPDYESEHDVLETVGHVCDHLRDAGFEVGRLGVTRNPAALVSGLGEFRPDAVFNLFEGFGDQNETEVCVAGLMDWLRIPYTGCPTTTLCLARDKPLTKRLLRGAGLPTPGFLVVDEAAVRELPMAWPVIVKPAQQDASVGLDQGSVVTDLAALNARVAHLLRMYGPPVLVEEFIPGRELNVAMVEAPELRPLPISEILFLDSGWPILTYDAKWKPGTPACELTPPRCPAEVDPELTARLHDLARRAYRLLGCRDYARVDFRVRPDGEPFILEVNPNPDFSPTAGLTRGLTAAGLSHPEFTLILARNALARRHAPLIG